MAENKNFYSVPVRFPQDMETTIKQTAENEKLSVNAFVIKAVKQYLGGESVEVTEKETIETTPTPSNSPIDEKIALMQANERLHALQAKTAAEKAAREHGEVKPVIKHPPKWAGLPGQRPDESNVEWVERKTAEANEIYKSAMERLKAEKESETK